MKKTLLSILAGVVVIGSASAVPGPEDRERMCKQQPDKYVWVEKGNGACVEINPCKSDNADVKNAYCNTMFKDVQLGTPYEGVVVVKEYINKHLGLDIVNKKGIVRHDVDTSLFAQDYIPAKLSDGGYIVFEFDDLSDIAGGDSYEGASKAACLIYGGNYKSRLRAVSETGFYCTDVAESDCDEVAYLASKILNGVLFTGKYDKTIQATTDANVFHDNVCTLFRAK